MNDRTSDNLLMIGARAPHAGATKTRLGQTIGMARAAALYAAFLADLASHLTPDGQMPMPGYDLAWTFSPPDADFRRELRAVTGVASECVHYVPQIADEDWGKRQAALLAWGPVHGYQASVLIASDSPQLRRDVIEQAFRELQTHDVVLGRVHDGGYYLIGQRGYHDILDEVPMSTTSAADGVIAHAHRLGLSVTEMPETFDIDVEEDLEYLRAYLAECHGRDAPATWQALRDLGLLQGWSPGSDM